MLYLIIMQKGFALPLILIGILIVIVIAAGFFYLGRVTVQKPSTTTPTPLPSVSTSEQKDTSLPKLNPEEYGVISFAKIDNKVVLRYKNKFYDKQGYPEEPISISNPNDYSWTGLVKAPAYIDEFIKNYGESYDEIFSFKVFPNGKKILFIPRWEAEPVGDQGGWIFPVYYYDPANSPPTTKILSFTLTTGNEYIVPIIDQISSDGNYVSFDMFVCWNCHGHHPEKFLYSIGDKKAKRIGKVLDFKWLEKGNYEFKNYIVKECEEPGPGICNEDPNTLPLLTGQM